MKRVGGVGGVGEQGEWGECTQVNFPTGAAHGNGNGIQFASVLLIRNFPFSGKVG